MFHICVPEFMILDLLSNSSMLGILNILDGPGTLSPVIKEQSLPNNGSRYQLESTSFCLTIVNIGELVLTKFIIGCIGARRQTNKDCFSVSHDSSQNSWEASVKMAGSAAHSNKESTRMTNTLTYVNCTVCKSYHAGLSKGMCLPKWSDLLPRFR